MPKDSSVLNITVCLEADVHLPPDELDRLTQNLRNEIDELDIESSRLVRQEENTLVTKTDQLITLGAIAVATLPSVLPQLVQLLQAWVLRAEHRTIKLKRETGDQSITVEIPQQMTPGELQKFINVLVSSTDSDSQQKPQK